MASENSGRCSGGGDILNEGGGSNSDGGGGSAGALADLDMRRHRRRVTERSAALGAATDCRIWKCFELLIGHLIHSVDHTRAIGKLGIVSHAAFAKEAAQRNLFAGTREWF